MNRLFTLCQAIHRFFALTTVLVFVLMSATGSLMRYPALTDLLPWVDTLYIRYIHGALAPFASLMVALMASTGIVLYLFPILRKRTARQSGQPEAS